MSFWLPELRCVCVSCLDVEVSVTWFAGGNFHNLATPRSHRGIESAVWVRVGPTQVFSPRSMQPEDLVNPGLEPNDWSQHN